MATKGFERWLNFSLLLGWQTRFWCPVADGKEKASFLLAYALQEGTVS